MTSNYYVLTFLDPQLSTEYRLVACYVPPSLNDDVIIDLYLFILFISFNKYSTILIQKYQKWNAKSYVN